MSERLRIQDPDLYNTWYNEMQATGIETLVLKSTKIAQHVEAIKHVLKRAREHQDVDLDDQLPVQSTSPEPVSPIRSDELEDMLNTLPRAITPIDDDLLQDVTQNAKEDDRFLQSIHQKINTTDNLWTFIYRGPEPTIIKSPY
ncbi:unnamed protein product [Dicrocoelium dendriticum]|nr:unnamed protein product [Dicrocoelium dendriticum]